MFFKKFFRISQIWTTSDSNNRIKWVENDIHVNEYGARSYPRNEKKFQTSCSGNTTTNVWPISFYILKSKWSLKIMRFVRISWYHMWRLWLKLNRFHTICHVRCLKTKVSQKKNCSVEKDSVRFGVKVMIELGFDFKTFCIGTRGHRLIHV